MCKDHIFPWQIVSASKKGFRKTCLSSKSGSAKHSLEFYLTPVRGLRGGTPKAEPDSFCEKEKKRKGARSTKRRGEERRKKMREAQITAIFPPFSSPVFVPPVLRKELLLISFQEEDEREGGSLPFFVEN